MMHKKIGFIINPLSGAEGLSIASVSTMLKGAPFEWEIQSSKKSTDIQRSVRYFKKKRVDVIAVHGGDGTIVQAAEALFGSTIPLLILPGGTANVLAKELKLPLKTEHILQLLKQNKLVTQKIDTGECNGRFFVVRINVGILADIVDKTPRNHKKLLGQGAYFATALKESMSQPTSIYDLQIDGREYKVEGIGLVVANSGNIGIKDMSLVPDCSVSDAYLDVILIKRSDPAAIAAFLKGSHAKKSVTEVVQRFRAKNHISISFSVPQTVVQDDRVIRARKLEIVVKPQSLHVLVPQVESGKPVQESVSRIKSLFQYGIITMHRMIDHLTRYITGMPTLKRSAVTPNLYVGGQYQLRSLAGLTRLGVTAIVNMRTRSVHQESRIEGFKYLHLPTPDRHAPSMAHIKKGVAFMTREIKAGGRIYAHCRFGEGRGVTIAIAYLLSTGLTYDDALALIRKVRTFARPTVAQRARLMEYAQSLQG